MKNAYFGGIIIDLWFVAVSHTLFYGERVALMFHHVLAVDMQRFPRKDGFHCVFEGFYNRPVGLVNVVVAHAHQLGFKVCEASVRCDGAVADGENQPLAREFGKTFPRETPAYLYGCAVERRPRRYAVVVDVAARHDAAGHLHDVLRLNISVEPTMDVPYEAAPPCAQLAADPRRVDASRRLVGREDGVERGGVDFSYGVPVGVAVIHLISYFVKEQAVVPHRPVAREALPVGRVYPPVAGQGGRHGLAERPVKAYGARQESPFRAVDCYNVAFLPCGKGRSAGHQCHGSRCESA